MRDLEDSPTWEDDLTGLGPEEGDPANGEEVSVIGDLLSNRTRYLYQGVQALNGAWLLVDRAFGHSTSSGSLSTLTTTTPINLGGLAGTVDLLEDDVVEYYTEYGFAVTGVDGGVILARHRLAVGAGTVSYPVVQRIERLDGVVQRRVWTSSFVVGASSVGAPAACDVTANLESPGTDPSDVYNPSVRILKVWRKVVL